MSDPASRFADVAYQNVSFRPPEIEHRYGDRVHILSDPLALNLLARLCSSDTVQPEINRLVGELYRVLLHVVIAAELPCEEWSTVTRMIEHTPYGVWSGQATASRTKMVCVALARAGLLPSQVAYDFLNQILDPKGVRQEHHSLGRTTGTDGHVTGTGLHAAKIGGPIDGSFVIIPDPMGATGSTVTKVLDHYRETNRGTAAKVIAAHLIITPEYLRHVRTKHPDVVVYALRLDRGLSAPNILATVPGTHWEQERGLNEHDYIVPGGGGLGEIMNNADC